MDRVEYNHIISAMRVQSETSDRERETSEREREKSERERKKSERTISERERGFQGEERVSGYFYQPYQTRLSLFIFCLSLPVLVGAGYLYIRLLIH